MNTRSWCYALASVKGTSHAEYGEPCQDASACEIVRDDEDGQVLVAVASDGAGSARRSQTGSSATCRFVTRRIGQLLDSGLEVGGITRDVVTDVVREAQAHLRATAEDEGAATRELACTLVAAVVGPMTAIFFQVGDGVIVVGRRTEPVDNFLHVFWPERGEYANTTTFLTHENVVERIQYRVDPCGIDEVAILTDGIEHLVLDYRRQLAHAPFFSRVMAPLRAREASGHMEDLSSALGAYLDSERLNEWTNDDKTLVLASRRSVTDE